MMDACSKVCLVVGVVPLLLLLLLYQSNTVQDQTNGQFQTKSVVGDQNPEVLPASLQQQHLKEGLLRDTETAAQDPSLVWLYSKMTSTARPEDQATTVVKNVISESSNSAGEDSQDKATSEVFHEKLSRRTVTKSLMTTGMFELKSSNLIATPARRSNLRMKDVSTYQHIRVSREVRLDPLKVTSVTPSLTTVDITSEPSTTLEPDYHSVSKEEEPDRYSVSQEEYPDYHYVNQEEYPDYHSVNQEEYPDYHSVDQEEDIIHRDFMVNLCDHPPHTFSPKFTGQSHEACLESNARTGTAFPISLTEQVCHMMYYVTEKESVDYYILGGSEQGSFGYYNVYFGKFVTLCAPIYKRFYKCTETTFITICNDTNVMFINPHTCPSADNDLDVNRLFSSYFFESEDCLAEICTGAVGMSVNAENEIPVYFALLGSCASVTLPVEESEDVIYYTLNFQWPSCYPFHIVMWLDNPEKHGLQWGWNNHESRNNHETWNNHES